MLVPMVCKLLVFGFDCFSCVGVGRVWFVTDAQEGTVALLLGCLLLHPTPSIVLEALIVV